MVSRLFVGVRPLLVLSGSVADEFCKEMNISKSTMDKAKLEGWGSIKSGKTKGWMKVDISSNPEEMFDKISSATKLTSCVGPFDMNDTTDSLVNDLKHMFGLA